MHRVAIIMNGPCELTLQRHAGVRAVPGPDARVPGRGARGGGGRLGAAPAPPAAAAGGRGGGRDERRLLGGEAAAAGGGARVASSAGADVPARGRDGVAGVRVRPHREPAVPLPAVGELGHRRLHRRGGAPGPRPPRRRQLRRLPRGALPRRLPARPALRRPQGTFSTTTFLPNATDYPPRHGPRQLTVDSCVVRCRPSRSSVPVVAREAS